MSLLILFSVLFASLSGGRCAVITGVSTTSFLSTGYEKVRLITIYSLSSFKRTNYTFDLICSFILVLNCCDSDAILDNNKTNKQTKKTLKFYTSVGL